MKFHGAGGRQNEVGLARLFYCDLISYLVIVLSGLIQRFEANWDAKTFEASRTMILPIQWNIRMRSSQHFGKMVDGKCEGLWATRVVESD